MPIVGSHQQAPVTIPLNGTAPVDANEVRLNDNAIIANYNAHDNDATLHVQSSSLGARPLPGTPGRLWFVTDDAVLYYDTGAAWVPMKVSGSSVIGGTVPVNAGGTGLSTLPADGQLLIGNNSAYSLATLTAGPNTVITNTPGGITISCLGAAAGTTSRTVSTVTATAGQTAFTVSYLPGYVDVYLNGVFLVPGTDYTATNGTSVVLASGAALNDELVFVAYTQLSLAAVVNGTGTANQLVRWIDADSVANSQITDDGATVGLPRYTSVRGVAYSWPNAQGGVRTLLQNDGSGNLSWGTAAPADQSITASLASPYAVVSADANTRLVMTSTSQGAVALLSSNTATIAVGASVGLSSLGAATALNVAGGVDLSLPNLGLNGSGGGCAVQGDGKVLLGGDFTTAGGTTRNRIARFNTDGSLDTGYNPNINNSVYVIVLQSDGKALVGGNFTTVGGTTRNYLARINTDGTLDSGFNANANAAVKAIAVQSDGKILVGGDFTTMGGTARNYVARLNADGTLDTSHNPNANAGVSAITLQSDGKALVVGSFTTVSATARNYIARVNTDGSLDSGYDPNADAAVGAIALQSDGKAIVGGNFSTIGGGSRVRLARLNTNGTLDTSFADAAPNGAPNSIVIASDGKVIVTGNITGFGTQSRFTPARLTAAGVVDASWLAAGSASPSRIVQQTDGNLWLMGGATVSGRAYAYRLFGSAYDGLLAPYASANAVPQYGVLTLEKVAAGQWLVTASNCS